MAAPDALFDALRPHQPVLLTGPVSPDGDSLGACLALQRVLLAAGFEVDVAGVVPWRYAWLPDAGRMVPDAQLHRAYGAVVILDGDRHRLTPQVAERFAAASLRGIIDHHGSTRAGEYDWSWLEPEASSTCQMVLNALDGWEVTLDLPLATCLYTGMVFDTGGFRHSNTSPAVLRDAARLLDLGVPHTAIGSAVLYEKSIGGLQLSGRIFGATQLLAGGRLCVGQVTLSDAASANLRDGDLEGVVEALLQVTGVDVAALVHERRGGKTKLSLRSRGPVDVAALAARMAPTGGGHPKAAGAVVPLPLADAIQRLEAEVLGA